MMRYIPEATQSRIKPNYDYMGRRYTKKVTSNGTVTLHQRYIYRGYLQIACVDLTRSEHPALWYITWDPTEPVATRPLAIQKNATWYTYSHDLTKNVTELYQSDGLIATSYDYSPYGAATAEGIDQPIQWSSEYHDPELALTYYNYRHYNPTDGRWINRDPIGEDGGFNLYGFVRNNALLWGDSLGQAPSRSDIEKALRETRLLLDQIQGRDKAKSQECCSDMYNEYLGKLSQLIKDVGEFYEDQWWISDEDQKAMGDVYALPSLIDGATMTPEQLSTLGDAVRSASKSMENNIFNKYCEEIQNGADFAAGFSDGAFFGLGEYISDYTSKLLYGEDTPWPSLDNGWYAGGIVTAFVTTTASYGFVGLPKNMIHFTTNAGAKGIKASGTINATKGGAFGPGTYMTQVGRPINLFVSKTSTVPIYLARPSGTVRIIPKLVYLRPFRSVKLP